MGRQMKDSGIVWFGMIPYEWKIVQVKRLFKIGRGRVITTTELSDKGYPVYSSQTKNKGILGYIGTYDFDRSQLTWTTDGANAGTVFLREGKHNCTNVCGTLMPYNMENNLKYLKYILEYTAIFHKRADINGYKIMNNEMADIHIVLPDQDSQNSIAAYLDEQYNCIDCVLEKTRASIEEYKKLKQAMITQAVTRGIRGDREMKDSCNIRWGKIPSDWNLIRIKNCIIDLKSGLSSVTNDENAGESGYYVLRTSAVSTGVFLSSEVKPVLTSAINRLVCPVEKDTIIVSRMNTSAMVGTCAYVDNEYPKMFLPDKLWKIHIKKKYFAKYFWYAINSIPARSLFDEISTGASMSMQNISVSDFINNYVTVPPLDEQKEIVHYLDQKCSVIDNLIAKKEKYLLELENYKKSLIYEYVTGKKEVP